MIAPTTLIWLDGTNGRSTIQSAWQKFADMSISYGEYDVISFAPLNSVKILDENGFVGAHRIIRYRCSTDDTNIPHPSYFTIDPGSEFSTDISSTEICVFHRKVSDDHYMRIPTPLNRRHKVESPLLHVYKRGHWDFQPVMAVRNHSLDGCNTGYEIHTSSMTFMSNCVQLWGAPLNNEIFIQPDISQFDFYANT